MYGYGTLAVGFVSACVVLALIVVRWKGTKIYRYLITTMLGLAVGSLAGDALLHLIPQVPIAHEIIGVKPGSWMVSTLDFWMRVVGSP